MQSLPFETPTQFAALALALIAGLFLGAALRGGRGKWRERYQDESLAHSRFRQRTDAELRERDTRIRQLEADLARVRTVPTAASVAAPVAATTAATSGGGIRSWFGGNSDSLARIRGIDAPLEHRLHDLGIRSFADIEKLSAEDEVAIEQRLDLRPGEIAAEGWREQAALLRAGNDAEHNRRFG